MRPITWYFQSDRVAASSRQSPDESNILVISSESSDLEYPEPGFDLRLGRVHVADWERFSPPVGIAESIACRATCQGLVIYDDLLSLVSNLPGSDLSSRPIFNTQDQQPHTFITGALVHGGTATTLSNSSIRLCCSIARQQAPTFWFTSLAVNLNCQSSVHRDSNNHSVLPSAIIPASIFTGGQLWVENTAGSIIIVGVPGEAVDIRLPYITFHARRRHATLSWAGNPQ